MSFHLYIKYQNNCLEPCLELILYLTQVGEKYNYSSWRKNEADNIPLSFGYSVRSGISLKGKKRGTFE